MITHPAPPTSSTSSAPVLAAPAPAPSTSTPAPDSPRLSESPPPTGLHGDLEVELLGLANALYNLGTTVISDLSREKDKPGVGKQVGLRVNQVVDHLAALDHNSQNIQTMIPMQVLQDIDNAKNPMLLTKDRLERAATENQFMNGKIAAIESYRSYLNEALIQSFPELVPHLTRHDTTEVKLEPGPDVP